MREWLARLRDWFRRDRLDGELQEELRFHAEQLARDAGAAGAPEDQAARTARRRLGNVTRIREEARDRWSWPWLERLWQDTRYAIRGLRRSPGFTATAVLTLGLGIGANAAMFGVIDRMMFRPFPYLGEQDRVNRVYLQETYRGETLTSVDGFAYTRYLDLQRWSTRFDRVAALTGRTMAVGTGVDARERPVALVSDSFFDFFDMRPVQGRFFLPSETAVPAGAPVTVVAYRYWQQEMGGGDVIGQTIRVRDLTLEVVGVAPEGFIGVFEGSAPDLYLPITTYAAAQPVRPGESYFDTYNWGWMAMLVRRAPGVTEEEASADLTNAFIRSWNREREQSPNLTPVDLARPLAIAGPLRAAAGPTAGLEAKTLLWVTGVAVVVLLIACANVTNLMLARVIRRRRETAVRLALGVSRGRLLAQGLTESVLLALLGCGAGVAIAEWGGAGLRHLFVRTGSLDVVSDGRTLLLAAGAALFAGLVTAVGPVLLAGRGDITTSLKAGVREGGPQRSRARTGLLVLQAALSVVLLVGAGLFVRSLDRVRELRLGYDADRVLMVEPNTRGQRPTPEEAQAFGRRFLAAAEALPGVEHAAFVSSVPFWSTSSTFLGIEGIDSVRRLGRFTYQTATADYFATLGTRILRGRGFEETDRAESPRVAVVSESMAGVLWPGRDPIGQCMRVGADTMPCTTVVGVAEDAFQNSLTNEQRFRYYLPNTQYGREGWLYLMLRMRGDPAKDAEAVRTALQPEMPGDGYVTVRPLDTLIDGQRRSWQVGATLFVAFGGLALLVAAVGLYGVITYNVAQRMHELGIRTALGARSAHLARLVMGQSVRLAAVGTVLGLAVAWYLARWIEPLLFRQSARDPVTYGAVAAVLIAVAAVASAVPARRATRADPNAALRSD